MKDFCRSSLRRLKNKRKNDVNERINFYKEENEKYSWVLINLYAYKVGILKKYIERFGKIFIEENNNTIQNQINSMMGIIKIEGKLLGFFET